MTALSVAPEHGHYTTINIFHTAPEQQAELSEVLAKGMHLLDGQPGFVATSVHESTDGTQVVSYVQWETEQAFLAMRGRPDAQNHFRNVGRLVSSVTTVACRVTQTHSRP
jgi:heme-degrading monooxygenase HmoA